MSYKDEFYLAPPLLARKDKSGRIKKMKFLGITMMIFKILAKLRILSGTRFDILAYQSERKEEHNTFKEFEALLDFLTEKVTAENYPIAVRLVTLQKQIRGYGYIKFKNLAQVKMRQQKLLEAFHQELIPIEPVVYTEVCLEES